MFDCLDIFRPIYKSQCTVQNHCSSRVWWGCLTPLLNGQIEWDVTPHHHTTLYVSCLILVRTLNMGSFMARLTSLAELWNLGSVSFPLFSFVDNTLDIFLLSSQRWQNIWASLKWFYCSACRLRVHQRITQNGQILWCVLVSLVPCDFYRMIVG